MIKEIWKLYYRQMRILRRETGKVMVDMLLYGIGLARIDGRGVRHVDLLSEEGSKVLAMYGEE